MASLLRCELSLGQSPGLGGRARLSPHRHQGEQMWTSADPAVLAGSPVCPQGRHPVSVGLSRAPGPERCFRDRGSQGRIRDTRQGQGSQAESRISGGVRGSGQNLGYQAESRVLGQDQGVPGRSGSPRQGSRGPGQGGESWARLGVPSRVRSHGQGQELGPWPASLSLGKSTLLYLLSQLGGGDHWEMSDRFAQSRQ